MALRSLRSKFYQQLEPAAWPHQGLSPVNLFLVILIAGAVALAVIATEPMIVSGREPFFDGLELIIGVIFLIEYLARVWIAPDIPRFKSSRFPRLRYMVTPIAIIDLLAVLPALFAFGGASSLILRFFRVLRLLRLAKLGRTSKAWEHIRYSLYQHRYEFGLILFLLLVTVLLSGSLLYLAEAEAQPDKFGSIPRALWWAIVTLTTVGYGDAYPVTALGRFFAGVIAVSGVMIIALPTGIFASSFTEAMARQRSGKDRAPDA